MTHVIQSNLEKPICEFTDELSEMSFLAGGRLAGKEGAYFFQESKQAVNRIVEKTATNTKNVTSPASLGDQEHKADVLPEVLRHSLPSKIFGRPSDPSSLSTGSKWFLPTDPNASSVSPDALNPLRAYVSLPQVTFGPKRFNFAYQIMLKLVLLRYRCVFGYYYEDLCYLSVFVR